MNALVCCDIGYRNVQHKYCNNILSSNTQHGFTLVELSIVLVIIGLIVGGVLVGRDLIRAATLRAQISQIEKLRIAVNTFQSKYNDLPGDITNVKAAQFGFTARLGGQGFGDGNGIVEGYNSSQNGTTFNGEPLLFWEDLSTAQLISGNFNSVNNFSSYICVTPGFVPLPISSCLPSASIGNNNFVYTWSGGVSDTDGINYFRISAVTSLTTGGYYMSSIPALSVYQAYSIDTKIDDGLPQSGKVNTLYLNAILYVTSLPVWSGNPASPGTPPYITATAGSSTTCFDNSNNSSGTPGVAGAVQHYSIEINGGSNVNCALSFQF